MYEVAYQPEADEDLEKLDKSTRERIIKKIHWLAKYIEPKNCGKTLFFTMLSSEHLQESFEN